jgi:CBS-domain-containing membrane protein
MYHPHIIKCDLTREYDMDVKQILKLLGIEPNVTGHGEKLISGLGALIAIALTMWVSLHAVGAQGAAMLVASMGASAVLLFAVPHGALSQPWQLIGGHLFSAIVGVTCAQLIADTVLAAALAVGLAIFVMHHLRCIHPPGGATALSAVVGGSAVHDLGYQFVLTPVLLNAGLMLLTAVAFNYAFPWRRYPASLKKIQAKAATPAAKIQEPLAHADFAYALREIGSYLDITEDDLVRIYKLASKHALRASREAGMLVTGNYYSNGEFGDELPVRKLLELEEGGDGKEDTVTYQIVAGEGEGDSGTMSKAEFMGWRRYEVIPADGGWHRIMEL